MDNKMILTILKLRNNLHEIYKNHNRITTILFRGFAALLLFFSLNSLFGNTDVMMSMLAAGLTLVCAVVPAKFIYPASVLMMTVHLYNVSWDVAACYMAAIFVSWVLVCRNHPNTGIVLAFTPLFFMAKLPFLLAVLVGMFSSLYGVGALLFGTVFYYLGVYCGNVTGLMAAVELNEHMLVIQTVMARFAANEEMLLLLVALVAAAVVAYVLCHQSFDYAWYIGSIAGGMAGLAAYLIGGIIFEMEQTNIIYIFMIPLAMCLACVIQFLRCIIDYSGVEYVEFEDDDYYYYVKAVPKVNVIVDDFTIEEKPFRFDKNKLETVEE